MNSELVYLTPTSAFMKRAFDICASAAGLVLGLPIALVVASAVLIADGPPILYRGIRVGRNGRHFHILKFRTMVRSADRMGRSVTVHQDPRVIRLGKILRRTKLDEIPQLINVLKGDMSFVGPRPEDPRYVRDYTDEQRQVLSVRPGITSVATLRYRNEPDLLQDPDIESQYQAILAEKLRLDLEYMRRRTFWTDLVLIIATLRGSRVQPDALPR